MSDCVKLCDDISRYKKLNVQQCTSTIFIAKTSFNDGFSAFSLLQSNLGDPVVLFIRPNFWEKVLKEY